ncbi:Hsp20/alpha crystallin family protein [Lysobacter sp. A6]|uniref:Hsp20/alpha crystallin family protein n=1 Tax=Noviluteimonas lactosilytica TaxID=2888523 RepID=A0ABS8JM77_9GAMM|nr:Hsp20/alpha crystallin family protein [Lysobacter lactosilyticus]MCC8364662.1 Hsp20/alpha crystallin family protein [Lysobacter lactosilyticus]
MTLPTRWNPLRQLAGFEPFPEIDSLMRAMARSSTGARQFEDAMELRLDVNEDDDAYVVSVDMPGVRKEDIDVSVDGKQVSIRAEVNRELHQGKGKEIHRERFAGEAFRTFSLPLDIDGANAKAAYDGGVLSLTLPKMAKGSARQLPIN